MNEVLILSKEIDNYVGEKSKLDEEFHELKKKGWDPEIYAKYMDSIQDRTLKKKYALVLTFLTVFFCMISYLVVILNAALEWGISDIAITGLLLETPIQFVGLLYVIANNLFPSPGKNKKLKKQK